MNTTLVAKLIFAASLIVSPIAASAAETSASQPAAAATAAAAPAPADKNAAAGERKICKPLPSSSSRLPQRVCLTEKQWKQVDADDQ